MRFPFPQSFRVRVAAAAESLSGSPRAPRRLPGRFTISVLSLVPAMPRESHAIGFFSAPFARIASAIPGASRSMTLRVASGVRSRGPRPVPPTVRIRWILRSAHSVSRAPMRSGSSGTSAVSISASGHALPQQSDHGGARGILCLAARASIRNSENSEQHGPILAPLRAAR